MSGQVFSHIGIACNDPEATERFYTKYFGFRRARNIPIGDGKAVTFIKSESGDLYFEIFQAEGEPPAPPVMKDGPAYASYRHFCFKVDSVDETLKKLGDAARITLGPMDFDSVIPGWRTVWIADPDDRIIEISQGYVDEE